MQDEQTPQDTPSTSSIERTIVDEFANCPLLHLGLTEPICRRCSLCGSEGSELTVDAGDTVYAKACWESLTGWTLHGLYHTHHDDVGVSGADQPKPTAILSAVLQRGSACDGETGPLVLTDLQLLDVVFPPGLR